MFKINNVININNVCNLIEKYDIVLIAYENEQIHLSSIKYLLTHTSVC